MFNEIKEKRFEFIKKTGKNPIKLHMTKEQMYDLSKEIYEKQMLVRARDLTEISCPNLLPPVKEILPVTEGCMIFGMSIVKINSDGQTSIPITDIFVEV